jgi:hypothetical protein
MLRGWLSGQSPLVVIIALKVHAINSKDVDQHGVEAK